MKHADMIIEWANGAVVQLLHPLSGEWVDAPTPTWDEDSEYRIKPEKTFLYSPILLSCGVEGISRDLLPLDEAIHDSLKSYNYTRKLLSVGFIAGEIVSAEIIKR